MALVEVVRQPRVSDGEDVFFLLFTTQESPVALASLSEVSVAYG